MKNKRTKYNSLRGFLAFTICILLCVSCQDKIEFTPDPIMGDVAQFYESVTDDPIIEQFAADQEHVYVSPYITSVHIPAHSLVYPDGSDVVGTVSMHFIDFKNKGELIIQNIGTYADQEILSTEGTAYLTFSQDGIPLSIKPGSLVMIRIKDETQDTDMNLYEDPNGDIPDWQLSAQSMDIADWNFFWNGKEWEGIGYELLLTETGWYSVAKAIHMDVTDYINICIEAPTQLYNADNSDVFIIFDQYDTVLPLHGDSENLLFCTDFENLAKGTEATLVVISHLGDENYHFGTAHATLNMDEETISVYPEPKTIDQILDLLGMF